MRGDPSDLAANVAFAFNQPQNGPDGRPLPTMEQLFAGAADRVDPQAAARVQATLRRDMAKTLRERARTDATARALLESTRNALPADSPLRRELEVPEPPRPRARPDRVPAAPVVPEVAPTDRRTPLSRIPHGAIDVPLPVGPLIASYKSPTHQFGTQRTIELIRRVAEDFHRETGLVLRVGDISARDSGDIPDHRAHRNGRNIDFDMAFSDGRSTAWGAENPPVRGRSRNDRDATWRSAGYDRAAT